VPIYEYQCQGCGKIVSKLHLKKDETAPMICPDCGGKLERILSSFKPVVK